jgi:hypothetical protein
MQRPSGLEALCQAGNKPRGCIGSPPERGAQAHRIRSGHVSVPTLAYARVSPVPGPRCGPDLTRRDLDPTEGTRCNTYFVKKKKNQNGEMKSMYICICFISTCHFMRTPHLYKRISNKKALKQIMHHAGTLFCVHFVTT